ncbi:MAG: hypothetical protein HY675_27890 [Chloroflexi bacterium]|nr:hypothetical protein [Chloroflexota bacterium]
MGKKVKDKELRLAQLNEDLQKERRVLRRAELTVFGLFILFFLVSGVSANLFGFEIGAAITVVAAFLLFVVYRQSRPSNLERIKALKQEIEKVSKS